MQIMDHHREGFDDENPLSVRFKFTPEELRAIKECNRESFYYRSLPFAAIGMVAVQFAVRQGYLKANAKWGSTPKVIGAGLVGWLLGKLSYRRKCEEKFMRLPNSRLGNMVRQRRGLVPRESFDEERVTPGTSVYSGLEEHKPFSDTLSLDTDKNVRHEGLDDLERPSLDREITLGEGTDTGSPQMQTTYDELRRKNREEHERRFAPQPSPGYHFSPQKAPNESAAPLPQLPQREMRDRGISGKRNEYGDFWES